MKGKRVLSLALAALMTLSLLVVPAAAVSFTDMTNHWAKDDVEYLATQGVVKGTSATTFAPDQKMTACEALLFCSRATGVDAIDKEAIARGLGGRAEGDPARGDVRLGGPGDGRLPGDRHHLGDPSCGP